MVKISRSNSVVKVEIPTFNLKYFDEFFKLKCRDDLLQTGWYNKPKEITESMAMFNAYRKYFKFLHDKNCLIMVVGDGVYPRTGCLFAFRTKHTIISIDPLLREVYTNVERLICIPETIEKAELKNYLSLYKPEYILLVFCHSHASLSSSVAKVEESAFLGKIKLQGLYIISMPCCIKDDLKIIKPVVSYTDFGVYSDKNIINIYKIYG